MATKNTKSVGNDAFYIQQACKMCPYPTSIKEGLIYVPITELEAAHQSLEVAHLKTLGFLIQSEIPDGTPPITGVFNPQIRLTPRAIERARNEFLVGDVFTVTSSGETLTVTHIERGKIHLAYSPPADARLRQKAPLLVSEEQLKRVLNNETWKRL
jgi:hypothetical protein